MMYSRGIEGAASSRRSQASHDAILKAAVTVVAERGYNNATIEQIAALAGAGKQTIYRWWTSKPFLFLEVYLQLVPVEDLVVDIGTCAGDLELILMRLSSLYSDTPAAAILVGLLAEAQCDPDFAAAFHEELIVARVKLLRAPMKRARARGEVGPDFDIKIAAELINAAVWYRLMTGDRKLSLKFNRRLVARVLAGQDD